MSVWRQQESIRNCMQQFNSKYHQTTYSYLLSTCCLHLLAESVALKAPPSNRDSLHDKPRQRRNPPGKLPSSLGLTPTYYVYLLSNILKHCTYVWVTKTLEILTSSLETCRTSFQSTSRAAFAMRSSSGF